MKTLTIITKDRYPKASKDITYSGRYISFTKEYGESANLYAFGESRKQARENLKAILNKGFTNVFESLFKKHNLSMVGNSIIENEKYWISLFPRIHHDYMKINKDGSHGGFRNCSPYVILSVAVKYKNSKKDGWDYIHDNLKTVKEYKELIKDIENED